jgi:flagellar capping protein FliD
MEWGQVLTIIFGVAGFMGIFAFLLNRRIDSVDKRIDDLRQDIDRRLGKIEEDIREIRQLLYKVLEIEKNG